MNWAGIGIAGRSTAGCFAVLIVAGSIGVATAAEPPDQTIALHLAAMLKSARTVISQNQPLINDPAKGDKGLTGERVLGDAEALYRKQTGQDPLASGPETLEGRLMRAEMEAIKAVMAENQDTINKQGVAFKAFIPAIFGRLVSEKFVALVGDTAEMKVTAPEQLIRNRKARPDAWEKSVLGDKFSSPDWPKGDPFSETTTAKGRHAFRLLVPEYYAASCLSCHGEPAGQMDITGYPKEGGHEGDLGSAISITLFE